MNSYEESRYGCLSSIVIMALLAIGLIFQITQNYCNPHWEQITVTEKNINPGDKHEKWLIYSEGEVYCIRDMFWVGFFNSSDVYNQITPGKTYDAYVSGKRRPFFSFYKNIRQVREVTTKEDSTNE